MEHYINVLWCFNFYQFCKLSFLVWNWYLSEDTIVTKEVSPWKIHERSIVKNHLRVYGLNFLFFMMLKGSLCVNFGVHMIIQIRIVEKLSFNIWSALSRWCISHRKKAKQVVETWEKLFKSAQHEQRVSFLYLSNDILQNSRRKGSEFVNEFWKVLPAALKGVYDSGNENCRKVASRLVSFVNHIHCPWSYITSY